MMKTAKLGTVLLVLALLAGCASTSSTKPVRSEFEDIPIPRGLEFRTGDSTIIQSPTVKAARLVYRGRLEIQSLATARDSGCGGPPRMRDPVAPRVERGGAVDRVEQEALVRLGRLGPEGLAVAEVEANGRELEVRPGRLRGDGERHALVGLDADRERVRLHARRIPLEDQVRRPVEADRDLAHALLHALARAEAKGNARPAQVVHDEPDGRVGLAPGIGGDALLLPVAGDRLALAAPPPPLPTPRAPPHAPALARAAPPTDPVLLAS